MWRSTCCGVSHPRADRSTDVSPGGPGGQNVMDGKRDDGSRRRRWCMTRLSNPADKACVSFP